MSIDEVAMENALGQLWELREIDIKDEDAKILFRAYEAAKAEGQAESQGQSDPLVWEDDGKEWGRPGSIAPSTTLEIKSSQNTDAIKSIRNWQEAMRKRESAQPDEMPPVEEIKPCPYVNTTLSENDGVSFILKTYPHYSDFVLFDDRKPARCFRFAKLKPVMVSLEKCAKELCLEDASRAWLPYRKYYERLAKAVLYAAGVKYE